MKLKTTKLQDVKLIELELLSDNRGHFARSFCKKELAQAGIQFEIVQTNISYNARKYTLRGLHFQVEPYAEQKIVYCTQGSLYDVVVDLRPKSKSYKQWLSVTLSATSNIGLYIPAGVGHGFVTLKDNTSVFYLMSEYYSPDHARTIFWGDEELKIEWPVRQPIISEKDARAQSWLDYLNSTIKR